MGPLTDNAEAVVARPSRQVLLHAVKQHYADWSMTTGKRKSDAGMEDGGCDASKRSKLLEAQERERNAKKETINVEGTTAADGRKNKAQSPEQDMILQSLHSICKTNERPSHPHQVHDFRLRTRRRPHEW